jgi:hypothetical protein
MRYSWLGATAAVAVTAVLWHLFVRPLDVVWITLIHRFGM